MREQEKQFEYVKEAFKEEPSISKLLPILGRDYLDKGLHTTAYVEEKSISLQFHGWEIVLSENGTYYINDTSGG